MLSEEYSRWPDYCCVPAFLSSSAYHLVGRDLAGLGDDMRQSAARTLGAVVLSSVPNPWGLAVSDRLSECGVKPHFAQCRFADLLSAIDVQDDLKLKIDPLNKIDFERHEEVLAAEAGSGAMVGIGFDFRYYLRQDKSSSTETALHVVRLTPFGDEFRINDSILSTGFGMNFEDEITVIDDSAGIHRGPYKMNWRRLLNSALNIHGAIWSVYR